MFPINVKSVESVYEHTHDAFATVIKLTINWKKKKKKRNSIRLRKDNTLSAWDSENLMASKWFWSFDS